MKPYLILVVLALVESRVDDDESRVTSKHHPHHHHRQNASLDETPQQCQTCQDSVNTLNTIVGASELAAQTIRISICQSQPQHVFCMVEAKYIYDWVLKSVQSFTSEPLAVCAVTQSCEPQAHHAHHRHETVQVPNVENEKDACEECKRIHDFLVATVMDPFLSVATNRLIESVCARWATEKEQKECRTYLPVVVHSSLSNTMGFLNQEADVFCAVYLICPKPGTPGLDRRG